MHICWADQINVDWKQRCSLSFQSKKTDWKLFNPIFRIWSARFTVTYQFVDWYFMRGFEFSEKQIDFWSGRRHKARRIDESIELDELQQESSVLHKKSDGWTVQIHSKLFCMQADISLFRPLLTVNDANTCI